jgi:uncharacterized DUF497 family protein
MYTRFMRLDYDPVKAAANLRKHRVSFADAEGVLHDPLAITVEDHSSAGERRFITIGRRTAGRRLCRAEWRIPPDLCAPPDAKGTQTV